MDDWNMLLESFVFGKKYHGNIEICMYELY